MSREDAARILACLVMAQKNMDAAMLEVESLDSTEETTSLRHTLASAIGTLACDAIAPILAQFPDLAPCSS